MKAQTALKTILIIALGGMTFSGYLSYNELFAGGCREGFIRCGSDFQMLNLPACVYGFFMYLAVTVVATLGLKSKK